METDLMCVMCCAESQIADAAKIQHRDKWQNQRTIGFLCKQIMGKNHAKLLALIPVDPKKAEKLIVKYGIGVEKKIFPVFVDSWNCAINLPVTVVKVKSKIVGYHVHNLRLYSTGILLPN